MSVEVEKAVVEARIIWIVTVVAIYSEELTLSAFQSIETHLERRLSRISEQ
jgi:hypothetical protein